MVPFTYYFLLLHLYHCSHVFANAESPDEAVRWLEAGRSVLIHLATPDLYFWNQRDEMATRCPGAFVFNFTLTPDHLTLLLNDEPILPRAHPHIPTPVRAPQIAGSATDFANRHGTNFTEAPVMDLDYYIATPDTTSGTSIYNTKYNPRLRLDILRAHTPSHPSYSTPISSDAQKQIWVYLEDVSVHPPGTPYANIPLRIKDVKVDRRWRDWDSEEGTTTYRSPERLGTCYFWSWLCADIREYPYYEYVYQQNFDRYGKKGSARHLVISRWGMLVDVMGFWQAVVLAVVCASVMVWRPVHAVYSTFNDVMELYRQRIREVDEWNADEEVEGLLINDRYLEGVEEAQQAKGLQGRAGQRVGVKKSRCSPPPGTLMKLEKK